MQIKIFLKINNLKVKVTRILKICATDEIA